MKKFCKPLAFALLMALLLTTGCDLNGTKNTETNPFIGTWKSEDVSSIPFDPNEEGRTEKFFHYIFTETTVTGKWEFDNGDTLTIGPYPCTYAESSFTVKGENEETELVEIQWKNNAKTIFSETFSQLDPDDPDPDDFDHYHIPVDITFYKQ